MGSGWQIPQDGDWIDGGACVVCGRYIVSTAVCPYCGEDARWRSRAVAVRVVLAALAVLLLAAAHFRLYLRRPPVVPVAELAGSDRGLRCVIGWVSEDGVRGKHPFLRAPLRFRVKDRTGSIEVRVSYPLAGRLQRSGRWPVTGDLVEVVGWLPDSAGPSSKERFLCVGPYFASERGGEGWRALLAAHAGWGLGMSLAWVCVAAPFRPRTGPACRLQALVADLLQVGRRALIVGLSSWLGYLVAGSSLLVGAAMPGWVGGVLMAAAVNCGFLMRLWNVPAVCAVGVILVPLAVLIGGWNLGSVRFL